MEFKLVKLDFKKEVDDFLTGMSRKELQELKHTDLWMFNKSHRIGRILFIQSRKTIK